MKFPILAGALALSLAAPLQAQSSRTPIAVVPYAGYLRPGALVDGPLGTDLSAAGGLMYGAQVTVGLTPVVALVGNVAHAAPDFQAGAPLLGSVTLGRSSIWLFDAGLQIGLPEPGRTVRPFVQAGAGAMRQELSLGPVGTAGTSFAWNVGAGADLALSPNLSLRLLAKDYVARFDAKEATSLDLDTGVKHNLALSAGLRLGF